jgi:hypothetical protein
MMKLAGVLFLFIICGCASGLETRVYKADRWWLFPTKEESFGLSSTSEHAGELKHIVPDTNHPPITVTDAMRTVAEECGVPFPSGAFVRVDTNNLTVTIRNTPVNNDRFENLMKPLGEGTVLHRIK